MSVKRLIPSSSSRIAATTVLSILLACTQAAHDGDDDRPGSDGMIGIAGDNSGARRVLDLTHGLSPDSLYWPSGSPFEFAVDSWGHDENGNWYAAAHFASSEHLGTHLDAPIHFAAEAWTSDQIPIERLVGRGLLVDISARAATDADTALQPADLESWEAEHGRIQPGAIMLIRSGWSSHWPDWNAYYGSQDPFDTSTLHFPGISAAAARLLVARGVFGVGIDTASIDPGADPGFSAHRVLAAAGIFNLENLIGLQELPERGFQIVALPIKITGGTGGPARVIALVPGWE